MVSKMNRTRSQKPGFSHYGRMVAAAQRRTGVGVRMGRTTKLNLGYQLHIETWGSGLLGQRSSR